MTDAEKLSAALEMAMNISQFDGSHHKAYAIDQIVRCLTGCPTITVEAKDYNGVEYSYEKLGESAEYKTFISEYRGEYDAENHEYEYDWDEGIAP